MYKNIFLDTYLCTRIIYFSSQLEFKKSIPLIQVHQKDVNLTNLRRSSEVWIGPSNDIFQKTLTSPNCPLPLARYLPQPVNCGSNDTLCTVNGG